MEDPGGYVRVSSLIPKEIFFQSSMADMDDDSLDDLIVHIRERLLAARQEQPQLLEVKAIPNGRNSH
jgi:hypothetical protein